MKLLPLLLLIAAPALAVEPAQLHDQGIALLEQSRAAYEARYAECTADLDDTRLALRTAEAELATLRAERLALIDANPRPLDPQSSVSVDISNTATAGCEHRPGRRPRFFRAHTVKEGQQR